MTTRPADIRQEFENRLGEFIRNQREVASMSVRRLADLAGVSNPYLSQIERGLRRPSAEILQQLANALKISVETLYEDWAMLRDARGFGLALLPPGSKHPPHIGIRVETREALEEAARRENRPVKEHRDRSLSFYTKGVGGRAVEVIYYPPEYKQP